MQSVVVSDAGPLIALAKLNLLHLLKKLYGRVYFPNSVYEEVVVEGVQQGLEDAHTLQSFLAQEKWMGTEVEKIPAELTSLHLDRGEKESLALALDRDALFLIDEEHGREAARQRDIKVRGTLGILVEAYRRSLIDSGQLRFYFGQLEKRADVWISPSLCRRILDEVLGPGEGV